MRFPQLDFLVDKHNHNKKNALQQKKTITKNRPESKSKDEEIVKVN